MEKKRVFSKSLILLAITSIMLFAMSITSMAATNVTNIRQTEVGQNRAKIEFNGADGAKGYYIYYSSNNGAKWTRVDDDIYPDSYKPEYTYTGLSVGCTYKVKAVPVYETYVSGTGYVYNAKENLAATGEIVTAPSSDALGTVKQIGATYNSVTIKWSPSYGTTKYVIYRDNNMTNGVKVAEVKGSQTSVKIKAKAGTQSTYYVYPVRVSSTGYEAIYSYNYESISGVKTAPKAPVKVASLAYHNISWDKYSKTKVTVGWDRNDNNEFYEQGYRIAVYSVDGKKKLKTYNITNSYTRSKTFSLKAIKNKGFRVKVSSYVVVNGKKCYSKWSKTKVVIPQADVKLTRKSKTSVKLSWKKVSNATGYTIYACKNAGSFTSNKKWYKVAKVGKKTTSYTVKKLKTGNYAGFYVIPTVKIGKKSYKADATWYMSMYMSKYY